MPHVGFRVSFAQKEAIEKATKKAGFSSTTEYILHLIAQDTLTIHSDEWELIAWNLFDMAPDQVSYALGRAQSAEEFFATIAHKSAKLQMKVSRAGDTILISCSHDNEPLAVTFPRGTPKLEAIGNVVLEIDKKIQQIAQRKLEEEYVARSQLELTGIGETEVQAGCNQESNGSGTESGS